MGIEQCQKDPCPANTYSQYGKSTQCIPCPQYHVTNGTGATSSQDCIYVSYKVRSINSYRLSNREIILSRARGVGSSANPSEEGPLVFHRASILPGKQTDGRTPSNLSSPWSIIVIRKHLLHKLTTVFACYNSSYYDVQSNRMFSEFYSLYHVYCTVLPPCPPGHYKLPSGDCQICPDGSFQSDGYSDTCQLCAFGEVTAGPGATQQSQCSKLLVYFP